MQTAVRFLYATAIALFLALTIGFGTLTFYPGPDRPDYPMAAEPRMKPDGTPTPQETEAMRQYEEDSRRFQDEERVHHRNVLLVVTGLAALALLVGVVASSALDVLRVGFMLGALFSVFWALTYGASAAGQGAIFVAALLVLVLLAALSVDKVRAWLARSLRLGSGDDLLR
jgi:hypothetical protein